MATSASQQHVRHFRQILIWPVQLLPGSRDDVPLRPWECIEALGAASPWQEVDDEFTGDPAAFQERHYHEFVTFLPHVQRFLYGEAATQGDDHAAATGGPSSLPCPLRVFRRHDVTAVRVQLAAKSAPVLLQLAHVDLYFFYDIDLAILACEAFADDLDLATVQDLLYRFGRAYPPQWDTDSQGRHCPHKVEWLGAANQVLAVSDYGARGDYLSHVCRTRSPRIASHWEWLLTPLTAYRSDRSGVLRYRQVEYYRMPLMAYLAIDDVRHLPASEFVRLAFVLPPGDPDEMPFIDGPADEFSRRHCYDRYWSADASGPHTRFLCCGHALVVVGDGRDRYFLGRERGILAEFRHQFFLLFLIAHFHKAALLMLSDRLMAAVNRLDIHRAESVKNFKRTIRQLFEVFLRFTHRYWFHTLSDQRPMQVLFQRCSEQLGSAKLYAEIRDEIQDMQHYLDSDSLRRQANTVVRLTVVTTVGLVFTITTGFLGMNLLAAAEAPLTTRTLVFAGVLLTTLAVTLYAIVKSKALSDFLEALSDERLPMNAKLRTLLAVWHRQRSDRL